MKNFDEIFVPEVFIEKVKTAYEEATISNVYEPFHIITLADERLGTHMSAVFMEHIMGENIIDIDDAIKDYSLEDWCITSMQKLSECVNDYLTESRLLAELPYLESITVDFMEGFGISIIGIPVEPEYDREDGWN